MLISALWTGKADIVRDELVVLFSSGNLARAKLLCQAVSAPEKHWRIFFCTDESKWLQQRERDFPVQLLFRDKGCNPVKGNLSQAVVVEIDFKAASEASDGTPVQIQLPKECGFFDMNFLLELLSSILTDRQSLRQPFMQGEGDDEQSALIALQRWEHLAPRIILDNANSSEFRTNSDLLFDMSRLYHVVAVLRVEDNFFSEINTGQMLRKFLEFHEMCRQIAKTVDSITFRIDYCTIGMVVSDASPAGVNRRANDLFRRILAIPLEWCKDRLVIGVGDLCFGFSALPTSYIEANKAIMFKSRLETESILYYKKIRDIGEYAKVFSPQMAEDLRNYIIQGDSEELSYMIEQSFAAMGEMIPNSYLFRYLESLVFQASLVFRKYCDDDDFLFDVEKELRCVLEESNLKKMLNGVEQILLSIAEKIHKTNSTAPAFAVERICAYININYADPTLSFSKVAAYFGFTLPYLSNLFSRCKGVTFMEYLSKLRIDKAKKLLENPDAKVTEVTELVGFNNQTYFSTRFKEIVGITPSQYRKVCRKAI